MNPRVHWILALTLALTLASCTAPDGAFRPSPTQPSASLPVDIAAQMERGGVREHMAALQKVADENGGTRALGTPGYDASVDYVAATLETAGYAVEQQTFDIVKDTPRTVALSIDGKDVEVAVMEGSGETDERGLSARLTVPAQDVGCAASDYADIQGTIALVKRGSCPFSVKAAHAKAAQVRAIIVDDNEFDTDPFEGTLGGAPEETIPVVGVTQSTGAKLRKQRAKANGSVFVQLKVQIERARTPTTNVIARWPADAKAPARRKAVMAGAHLDSVPAGPGINDNGSGVALVLELAQELAENDAADGAEFGFWAAEEIGLRGSEHYVRSLDETQLADLTAYLNFDMVSSPNGVVTTYGSPAIVAVLDERFAARGRDVAGSDIGDYSDHASFDRAGVPVGGVFTGAIGDKSPAEAQEWGGEAGRPVDGCYHRACDTASGSTTATSDSSLDVIVDVAGETMVALLAR